MDEGKKSIQNKFLKNMITIALVSTGLWCVIWISSEYSSFKAESESLRVEHLESQKQMLQFEVAGVVEYVQYMKVQANQNMKRMLKKRVYEAHAIALNIYRKNKTSKTLHEIGDMTKEALRPIRFNSGRGYYFAVSMDGVEQLYPIKPEFEGKSLIDLQDSKDNYVIRNEISIIKNLGEGFVKDFWAKPNEDTAVPSPKISFVKYFKPLDWYFGTGEYLDNAKDQTQNEVLNRIIDLRFGKEGYFFGSTFGGEPLFSNGKITVDTGNIWNLTDPNGLKIIQEQQKAAKKHEGGFVSYSWRKMGAPAPSPKISYVLGIPEWKWTIGAGVYIDTIEDKILAKKKILENSLKTKLINTFLILIALLLLILFWSKQMAKQLANEIGAFSSSLIRADTTAITINTDKIDFQELKKIAELTNKMLEDRKKAEHSLRESEALLNASQRLTKVGGWEWDVDKQTMFWTQEVYRIHDLQPIKISAGSLKHIERGIECYDPADRPVILEAYRSCIEKGQAYDLEFPFTTAKGKQIWVRTIAEPIRKNGSVVKVIGNLMDITERKKAEEIIKRSESMQNKMVANIGDVIVIVDQDAINRYKSTNIEKLFGWKPEDVVGESTWENIHPDDLDAIQEFFRKLMSEPGSVGTTECRYRCKDGSYSWIEFTGTNLLHDPDINGLLGNYHDITKRKRLEERLQQSQKMEAIGTLAGGIAHDFNNILFPVLGHTEMLLRDIPEDNPIHSNLEKIYIGAIRARDLVKQILTFSRQEKSELKLMRIQPIIMESLKFIRSSIPATINIIQDIRSDCEAVKADPTHIHQIIMNLTTNAYHAMETTGGELKVSLKEIQLDKYDIDIVSGNYACLSIADTGAGIDEEFNTKIFDPFFTTKEVGKGTGMGLSVVHGIVKNMNGFIQVKSKSGIGTEFKVYLPVEKCFSEIQNHQQTDEKLRLGTERILLVDDEEAILSMEKQMLERMGYKVTSRIRSIEALECFRAIPDKFNLVITDMSMPNMAGDKLSAELVKISPDIPIILCTGFSETISEKKAAAIGIKSFLLKPIVMKDLSDKIREVLDENKN